MNDAHTSTIWQRVRTAQDHTGTTFESHLEGTASLLRAWGQQTYVELAGRYHAVYGNPRGRGGICSPEAPELVAEIGEEAEFLVRVWSRIDRKSLAQAVLSYRAGADPLSLVSVTGEPFSVNRRQFVDLAHLQAANAIEMASRRSQPLRQAVQRLRPVLCPDAVALMNEYCQRPWPARKWAAVRNRVSDWMARCSSVLSVIISRVR